MSKLHEAIAAQSDRTAAATANLEETEGVFSHKAAELFVGRTKITKAVDDGRAWELDGTEEKQIQTNVPNRLKYLFDLIEKDLDCRLQIDTTNQSAVADLVLEDGTTLATKLPVTFLLTLEKQAKRWREAFAKIPTLETGIDWEPDTNRGAGYYKSKSPAKGTKTEAQPYAFVLLAPTEKHPGQAVEKSKTVTIALTEETVYSGKVRSVDKARWMANCQELEIAAKKARQRANEANLIPAEIGGVLYKFIFAPPAE